jgi:hypothetical protein
MSRRPSRGWRYTSGSVGATRLDKNGQQRPEAYKFEILPGEAAAVLRVLQVYARGLSVIRVVRVLNTESVPGRMRTSEGWSPATVSWLLDNEKHIGRWVWNKQEAGRNPRAASAGNDYRIFRKRGVLLSQSYRKGQTQPGHQVLGLASHGKV